MSEIEYKTINSGGIFIYDFNSQNKSQTKSEINVIKPFLTASDILSNNNSIELTKKNKALPLRGDISRIEFGVLTYQEIPGISVKEICHSETDVEGSVYDPHLGVVSRKNLCETCRCDTTNCPGHFGHIKLNYPVINPLFIREILLYLNYICGECHKPYIDVAWWGIIGINSSNIFKKLETIHICSYCKSPKLCYAYEKKMEKFRAYYTKNTRRVFVSTTHIQKLLLNISRRDVEKLAPYISKGTCNYVHPSNYVLMFLPVAPLAIRADVDAGGKKKVDDITFKYTEIIKANKDLEKYAGKDIEDNVNEVKHVENLLFHINTLFDNSSKRSKQRERPIKGIKPRLCGKGGVMRGNLMGKRVDYNARCVIGCDMSLDVDEIIVPIQMISSLTPRVCINQNNYKKIIKMIISGQVVRLLSRKSKEYEGYYNQYNLQIMLRQLQRLTSLVIQNDIPFKLCKNSSSIDSPRNSNGGPDSEILKPSLVYKSFKLSPHDFIFFQPFGPLFKFNGKTNMMNKTLPAVGKFICISDILNPEKKIVYCNGINNETYAYNPYIQDYEKIREPRIACTPDHCIHNIQYYIIIHDGDYVERKLMDGDYLLFNRQPTLHRGSIIAMRCKISDIGKTIRMNLAITASYNADFDGDEMNLHLLTAEEGEAEMKILSTIERLLLNPQTGDSIIELKQDTLLALYLLTFEKILLPKSLFMDCVSVIKNKNAIHKYLSRKDEPLTGHNLISLIFPDNLFFHAFNKDDETKSVNIIAGIMKSGVMSKGTVHGIIKTCSPRDAIRITSDLQYIATKYLMGIGFSVGISDCVMSNIEVEGYEEIPRDAYDTMFVSHRNFDDEQRKIRTNYLDNHDKIYSAKYPDTIGPILREKVIKTKTILSESDLAKSFYCPTTIDKLLIRESNDDAHSYVESQINNILNNLRNDIFMYIVDKIKQDNRIKILKDSGAKGKPENICQIVGILGQQNIEGMRIGHDGVTDIPYCKHLEKNVENNADDMINYKRRGFVCSSFIKGLDPLEFWEHSASGRDGNMMMETQVPNIGYCQRRCGKKMEDYKIINSSSKVVVDTVGNVVQFDYGGDGLDGSKMNVHTKNIMETLCYNYEHKGE